MQASQQAADELEGNDAEITLRLQLGTVMVKCEPREEPDGAACGVAQPPSPVLHDTANACYELELSSEAGDEAPTVTVRCRLGLTMIKQEVTQGMMLASTSNSTQPR